MDLTAVLKFELINDGASYEVSRACRKSEDVEGALVIPANHEGKPVTKIAAREGLEKKTFFTCKKLTSVTIPESVEIIGKEAFAACDALEEVIISNGVKEIGDLAFRGCSKLETIVIPNSVTIIGNSAFYECANLTNVTLPENVQIGESAFGHCKFKLKK